MSVLLAFVSFKNIRHENWFSIHLYFLFILLFVCLIGFIPHFTIYQVFERALLCTFSSYDEVKGNIFIWLSHRKKFQFTCIICSIVLLIVIQETVSIYLYYVFYGLLLWLILQELSKWMNKVRIEASSGGAYSLHQLLPSPWPKILVKVSVMILTYLKVTFLFIKGNKLLSEFLMKDQEQIKEA